MYLIVIGHVDAGKSTIMGHVLHKLGYVSPKLMNQYEHETKKVGKQSFVYAWILDETGEERLVKFHDDTTQHSVTSLSAAINNRPHRNLICSLLVQKSRCYH